MPVAGTRAKIDHDTQAFDRVLADRLAFMERAPGGLIGACQDQPFQGLDFLAIRKTKQRVMHEPDYRRLGKNGLDRWRQASNPARHRELPSGT